MIRLLQHRYPPPFRLVLPRRNNSSQARPLAGFYLELLTHPLTPANPAAPRATNTLPTGATNTLPTAALTPAQGKASIVFGTRLAGPGPAPEVHKAAKLSRGETIAGVYVPPRPEEPDNCCMSGCVSCVMTTFLEDLEEWRDAKKAAELALKKMSGKPVDELEEEEKDLYDGFEGIPVGMRAFMEMERKMKAKMAK